MDRGVATSSPPATVPAGGQEGEKEEGGGGGTLPVPVLPDPEVVQGQQVPQWMPRIAVIGAGVAGSACAATLQRAGMAVTIFDQGRGPGGRAGSRTSRLHTDPDMRIDHGCPHFDCSSTSLFRPEVDQLVSAGVLKKWTGIYRQLDDSTGVMTDHGVVDPDSNSMTHFADELFGAADAMGLSCMCSQLLESLPIRNVRYGTQVTQLKWNGRHWTVIGRTEKVAARDLGTFDWLVCSTFALGHPRFQKLNKLPPPLCNQQDARFTSVVKMCSSVESSPVQVVLLAFKDTEAGSVAGTHAFSGLPFDTLQVRNSEVVERIIYTHSNGYHSFAVHSTNSFGVAHADVVGSESVRSCLAGKGPRAAVGSSSAEASTRDILFAAFLNVLGKTGVVLPKDPDYGPSLHRWGSAFNTVPSDLCPVSPDLGLAFCGDWTSLTGGVSGSAESGLEAAAAIIESTKQPSTAAVCPPLPGSGTDRSVKVPKLS